MTKKIILTQFFKTLFLHIALFNSVLASAYTIDEYKELLSEGGKGKEYIEMYVMGLGQGFNWANVKIRLNKDNPIFCSPSNLTIDGHLILKMVNDGLEKTKLKGTAPLELYVLQQLAFVFPCK